MAIIKCPACGQEVSDKSEKCIHCGNVPAKQVTAEHVCPECRNEVPKDAGQCPHCGCPLNVTAKKKSSKKLIIAALGILVIIAVICCGSYLIKNANPIKKYINLVAANKKDDALEVYNEIKNDEELAKELSDIQNAEIDMIYQQFADKKVSNDDAIASLESYLQYDSSKKYANTIKEKIVSLNVSRKAYEDGEAEEKNDEIEKAIAKYKLVIEEDESYQDAQAKIEILKDKYKTQLLDEAENYCQNKQYKEAIKSVDKIISTFGSTDELSELKEEYAALKAEQYAKIEVTDKSVTPQNTSNWIFSNYVNFVFEVTNNSDKAIKGIEGFLTVSDLFGKEIIKMGNDFTGKTIQPGETITVSDLSFECNEFISEHMKLYNTDYSDLKFVYDITSIVYEDGSTIQPE